MKKLVLLFALVPGFAFAGGLGVSMNDELFFFEIIILAIIGIWLGGEYGIKWLVGKIREWRLHHHHVGGDDLPQ